MPPTVTVIPNAPFTTSSGTGGERINIDYRMELVQQRESAAPFLTFMLHLNSENTQTHQFNTFETRPNPKKSAVVTGNAVGAGAGTSRDIVVANADYFKVGNLVRPSASLPADATQTNFFIITAITYGTDTITVAPNNKALILCATTTDDELVVWGNSYQQATLSGVPMSTKPILKTFYTQIFKDGYQVSKTQANNRLYGAPERDRQRAEKEIEHVTDINKNLYMGEGLLDTSGTYPRTTLTGLDSQIETDNVLGYDEHLEADELFDFMTTLHAPRYAVDGNLSRRLVLASADIINDINKIAQEQKRLTMERITVYNVSVTTLTWANRTWDLVEDPQLSLFLPGTAYVVQPRYVKLREFRPTRLEANIQPNNADYFEDQFLTELGLEVLLPELHGKLEH
jgi:hypothetical protein